MTDASHCPNTKVGGYGVWIASQRGKRSYDGAFKNLIDNATIAEMAAITNGLYIAIRTELVQAHDRVLIQTDCIAAILAFTGKRKPAHSEERRIVEQQRQLMVQHNLSITFKHVKGHSDNEGNRFVSNNICDRKAKANMKKARQLFKLDEIRQKLKETQNEK